MLISLKTIIRFLGLLPGINLSDIKGDDSDPDKPENALILWTGKKTGHGSYTNTKTILSLTWPANDR